MTNQIEKIRQLKDRGMSIRDIANELLLSKYEVEKAFVHIKALGDRPDSYPDTSLDDEPDNWSDTETSVSRQHLTKSPVQKSPKDLPSEWHTGVTRVEADFIISAHIDEYEAVEIKALYESKHPLNYMSLHDIRRVIQAYEQEETHQNAVKAAAKKANDEQTFRQFSNFVGEDVLTFLLWISDVEEWEESEMRSCLARAATILNDIESFCRTNKFQHQQYEPYSIIVAVKNAMSTGIRKDEEPEFDDKTISFLEMLGHRPLLERYFWKMLDLSRSNSIW